MISPFFAFLFINRARISFWLLWNILLINQSQLTQGLPTCSLCLSFLQYVYGIDMMIPSNICKRLTPVFYYIQSLPKLLPEKALRWKLWVKQMRLSHSPAGPPTYILTLPATVPPWLCDANTLLKLGSACSAYNSSFFSRLILSIYSLHEGESLLEWYYCALSGCSQM